MNTTTTNMASLNIALGFLHLPNALILSDNYLLLNVIGIIVTNHTVVEKILPAPLGLTLVVLYLMHLEPEPHHLLNH